VILGAHYAQAPDEPCLRARWPVTVATLGIAFQIADDLLDLLGDEGSAGKTLGSDLDKQKLTLPLIRLLDRAPEPDAARLRALLASSGALTRRDLLAELERSDALHYAQQRAREFAQQARFALNALPESPARRLLEDLTEFAIQRQF
jgi:octaprenyl-diphosphate synthase